MKLLLEKLKPGHLQNDKIEISQCKKRERTQRMKWLDWADF